MLYGISECADWISISPTVIFPTKSNLYKTLSLIIRSSLLSQAIYDAPLPRLPAGNAVLLLELLRTSTQLPEWKWAKITKRNKSKHSFLIDDSPNFQTFIAPLKYKKYSWLSICFQVYNWNQTTIRDRDFCIVIFFVQLLLFSID